VEAAPLDVRERETTSSSSSSCLGAVVVIVPMSNLLRKRSRCRSTRRVPWRRSRAWRRSTPWLLRESCKRERVSSGGGAKERERSTPWPWRRSTPWLLGSSSCGEREFVVERDQAAPRREREGCCRELHAWREETFFRWPVAARDSYQDILGL
jgi:hypothetical protein